VPDEVTPETGNTTETTAAQVDWESAENPYLQRYRDAQSHLTPVQQENARLKALEQDQQAYIELGKQQGWIEVEDPNAVNDEFLDPRLAQMIERDAAREERLAQLEQRAQAEELEASREQFRDNNAAWAKEAGVEFDKADHAAVLGLLFETDDPTSMDAHQRVFADYVAQLKARDEAKQAAWEEARRRPRVPTPPTGGQAATGAPNWGEMSEAQINEYMAERAAGRV
jgi:hypothetical protein